METTLDKTQLKAIITEALIDLLKHDREIFHEIVLEVIEEIGLVNAIKEAENDEDIDESKILEILDEVRQLRNSIPTKGKPLSQSVIENRAEEAQENNCQFQDKKALLAAIAEENRQISDQLSQQLQQLGGTWGRFVEDVIAPCEQLLLDRGIPVDRVSQKVRGRSQGNRLEIDVLVVSQGHVLAVQVRSRLSVDDVKDFVADLECFRDFFPEYAQMQIYGAVAGIGIDSGADRYAYRQGLFVLAQAGDDVVILNDDRFEPKPW